MSNPTVDSYVQQYFGDNAPPGLSDVAYLKAADATPGGSPRQLMARMQLAQQYIQNLASSGDIKSYIQDATNTLANKYTYYNLQGTDSSGLLKDIQSLVNSASNYGLNSADLAKQFSDAINTEQQKYVESKQNLDTGGLGGFLNNFISAVTNPVTLATIVAAPLTGGASLALGEEILGTGAAGAATLGSALLGAAESGVLASLTGGDVVKSIIGGSITAGVGANAANITSSLGIDSQSIANSVGLTKSQIDNLISGAISNSVVQVGLNNADFANTLKTQLASTVIGDYAQNIVNAVGGKDFSTVAKLVGNVSNVATKAIVNNQDISTAIQNNIPSIIGTTLQSDTSQTQAQANATTTTANVATQTSQTDTSNNTAVVVASDPASNTALVIDTSGNVTIVATTQNIQSGSTVNIDPNTNVATVANAATTGQTFQPVASTDTTLLIKKPEATVEIGPQDQSTNAAVKTSETNIIPNDAVKQADGTFLSGDTVYTINADGTVTTSKVEPTINPVVISQDNNIATVANVTPTIANITPTITNITPTITNVVPTIANVTPTITNTTQQIIDLINQPTTTTITPTITNVPTTQTIDTTTQPPANVTITATTSNQTLGNGSIYGTGNAATGNIGTQDITKTATITPNISTTITETETPKANVTISTGEANVTDNVATTANVSPNVAVTSPTISPTVIYPSTKQPQLGGILGASPSSILGQALAAQYETSPGGSPITLGDEGKRRNVWNVESLRNALGI